MKKQPKRFILAIVAIVEVMGLAVLGVYAWIEGGMSPQLVGSDISITNSPGLTMLLNNDPAEVININDFISDPSVAFFLAEASSADGSTIFIRDNEKNTENGDPYGIYVRQANDNDKNSTYITFNFELKVDAEFQTATARPVWLDASQCYIRGTADDPTTAIVPVRVSLTYSIDGGTSTTYIFAENWDSESDGEMDDPHSATRTLPVASCNAETGVPIYNAAGQYVQSFGSYSSSANPLFSIAGDSTVSITVCIWLEGADPLCIDEADIAGTTFFLSLFFKTYDDPGA